MGGSFHYYHLRRDAFTAEELDQIALDGGLVKRIAYGYTLRGEVDTDLPGGWSARWVDTRGMGNHGDLVLVPTDPRTRAIAREGRIRQYMAAGLNRVQAERLHHCQARYKGELAPVLAEVLSDPAQVRAFMAHPQSYGWGSGRSQWQDHWGGAFPGDALARYISAPREAELAKMVAAVATI